VIVSSYEQIINFLTAALVGACLGVVYDFFKVLRLIGLNGSVAAFFEDILFFLISAVTLFSYYMQFTQGKFRIYAFVAAALGFAVYFFTVEKIVFFVIKKIYFALCKIFGFIYNKLVLKAFKFISAALKKLIKRPVIKFGKFLKQNICLFLKKLLPKKRKMLYNDCKVSKKGKRRLRHVKTGHTEKSKAFFC